MLRYEQFVRSIEAERPPSVANVALRALWHERRGNVEAAHALAEGDSSASDLWVRAYLRRKAGEADLAYHYWRAGVPEPSGDFDDEWSDIVHTILAETPVANAYGA